MAIFVRISADPLEANPENISKELMSEYRDAGINRVSIGVQSLDDDLLAVLTRQHDAKKALKSVEDTYYAGIENISIDLMYDLPGQKFDSWKSTLNQTAQLPISHLSLYNLTIEPHTIFFKNKERLQSKLPSDEVSTSMYQEAIETFTAHHFKHYEISAFCKPSLPSIHNTGYWTDRQFVGLGPSAFSYWGVTRFRNIPSILQWHEALKNGESPVDFSEMLSPQAHEREKLAIRLRLLNGASLEEFQLEDETRNTIDKLVASELLIFDEDRLKLTDKGILFYDTVATELI